MMMMMMSGEGWIGLERLHKITRNASYQLHVTLVDWDDSIRVAVYDQFEVV